MLQKERLNIQAADIQATSRLAGMNGIVLCELL
jgi:hypothetical protein